MQYHRINVSWVVPLLLLLTWEAATRLGCLGVSQSAPPTAVIKRLVILLATGNLLKHLALSLLRLGSGVLIGALLGTASGVVLSSSRGADRLFSGTIQFLAGVPLVVWMPLWIILLGTGEGFKIGLATTATYFLVHIHTFVASRTVAVRYIELADIYEKTYLQKIFHIVLPAAIASILTAVRISIAIGWIVIFFVEYAASREGAGGIGWFVADARQVGRVEDEFAGLILLGVLGFSIDYLVSRAQRRISLWSDSMESALAARS